MWQAEILSFTTGIVLVNDAYSTPKSSLHVVVLGSGDRMLGRGAEEERRWCQPKCIPSLCRIGFLTIMDLNHVFQITELSCTYIAQFLDAVVSASDSSQNIVHSTTILYHAGEMPFSRC